MSNAEIIGSTNLIILLEDEIFADFFNTFLSLPVFGQTPFYNVDNSQWSLWPEIPYDLIVKYKGLLTWLEKYRLPFFCKTTLCFYYILCQELISFIKSQEGAKMMRWQKADQWLLEKCVGGVRGIWRFCSYLKGSAGEELVDFWILAEKILGIDETDMSVKDHYLSLLFVLKATHLQEGSRVVTLCNMNIKSLLNLSIWHPNQSITRREVLSHMQKVALFKIQSYWLPNFYTHAKTSMANDEACQGLMQEYETRLCSVCCSHEAGLPLNMSIKNGCHPPKKYSTKKAKRRMWHLINPGSWSLDMEPKADVFTKCPQELSPPKKVVLKIPALQVTSSKEGIACLREKDSHCAKKPTVRKRSKGHLHMEDLFETKFSAHLRTSTPLINRSSSMSTKKALKHSFSFEYTHWALCADVHAGNPFRDHLKKMNLQVEMQLLDLWQDLQHFLSVLTESRKKGDAVFRHMLGNRICELYLNEHIGPCLPLTPQTLQGLKKLLPTGDVNPWIPKAQKEICMMLSPWYGEFLDEEDYWFLMFTTQTRFITARWHKKETTSREENLLLYNRLQESLQLNRALANMEDMTSMEWQKIATEDLRQGGSLQVEMKSPVFIEDINKMSFEKLCYKNPKMAIEKISEDYKIYCQKAPPKEITVEIIRQPKVITHSYRKASFVKKAVLRKPSMRPRNMTEVLLNTQHLEYFQEFLKERKAEIPLQFLIAIQKISMETNEKLYQSALENITKTFFHGKTPPEEILQCNAPIIKEIVNMHHINTTTLLALQGHVMKSLEEKWFKDYQDMFPPRPMDTEIEVQSASRKPSKTTTYLQESLQNRGWMKMISFIKSFCKYRRYVANPTKRQQIIDFLHMELFNKENFSTLPTSPTSGRPTPGSASTRSTEQENGEMILIKRRIFGHRVITVSFAVNDLYFFSEMEKFNNMVSSAHILQVNKAYNENDIILLRSKINIILKLYLVSDIPPKLRVNITETQKDVVLAAVMEGHLDRTIFHGAIMSVFPVIMYFWKRFCAWKANCSYLEYMGKKIKDTRSPPKSVSKYPPWSTGDHEVLRFSLLRGIEWLQPQQRSDVMANSIQNMSFDNLAQLRPEPSATQLSVLGQKVSSIKKEKNQVRPSTEENNFLAVSQQ